MASLIYNTAILKINQGTIVPGTDTFKMMLVTGSYVPDKDAHVFRSDVTNEVTGTGYTAGGTAVTCTPSQDNANDRVDLTFSNPSWPTSTITARAGVIYKSRGGAASADELVAYVDFGSNIASTGGTFAVTMTGPLRYQN